MNANLPFHVDTLKTELNRRLNHNPRYSLRSFARDLKVTPSWLSEFLQCKKGVSHQKAEALVDELELTEREKTLFLLSVATTHSRSPARRKAAHQELTRYLSEKVKVLSTADEAILNHWYHYALLELLEVEGVKHSSRWIAHQLELPIPLVERALQDLRKMGWLKVENGKIKSLHHESTSSFEIPSTAIKNYHEQILEKAKVAIHNQSVSHREFSNMTLAFASDDLKKAKKFIRDMQKEFARRFYDENQKKDSVYQFSIQLFRLDKGGTDV